MFYPLIEQLEPVFSWTNWDLHPDLLIGLFLLEAIYLLLVGPLRFLFVIPHEIKPTYRQVSYFSIGVLVFFIADNGPIHDLSENFLFSAHMLQHILLAFVVSPLLIIGTPGWLLSPLLKYQVIERTGRFLTNPLIAFFLFNLTFSLWHLPILYQAALQVHGIHIFEHLTLLVTAVILWWPILSPVPELPRPRYLIQVIYLFVLPIAQLIVFAPITFSTQVIYPFYAEAPRLWGLSALADQQMGGILMKVTSTIIFLLFLTIVFFRWFNQEEEHSKRENDSTYIK